MPPNISLQGFPSCIESKLAKYTSRNSPPFPANECPTGLILEGKDGLYITSADSKGTNKWIKYKGDQPVKVVQKVAQLPKVAQKHVTFRQPQKIQIQQKVAPSVISLQGFPSCIESKLAKYTSRNSPPFPANECPVGLILEGKDGLYITSADSKGTNKWIKHKGDQPVKVVKKVQMPKKMIKQLVEQKQVVLPQVKRQPIDLEQEITIGQWKPESGIMKYKEIRPRQVQANPVKNLKPFIGYYVSQKFDGWQVTWNGTTKKLTSHTGSIEFDAPEWWLKFLPTNVNLAGELIIPGKQAAKVSGLRHRSNEDWATALFMVFDILGTVNVPFEKRTKKLEQIVRKSCQGDPKCPLRYVEQNKLNTVEEIFDFYKKVVYDRAGQGIVMTKPQSFYLPGGKRSGERVKLKRREDTEGTVVGYNDDENRLSSLLVRMDNGVVFNLGIGFSFDERARYKELFPIGTLVKFSYRELTDGGKPKQARFVEHRLDLV